MILGEIRGFDGMYLEDSYSDDEGQYDAFFWNKKKRQERSARRKARRAARAKDPKVIARKAKRKKFFKGLGDIYDDLGGATGIGTAIDAITRPKSSEDTTKREQENDLDYSYGLQTSSEDVIESEQGLPMGVYLVGGVMLLGITTLGVMYYKNKQKIS